MCPVYSAPNLLHSRSFRPSLVKWGIWWGVLSCTTSGFCLPFTLLCRCIRQIKSTDPEWGIFCKIKPPSCNQYRVSHTGTLSLFPTGTSSRKDLLSLHPFKQLSINCSKKLCKLNKFTGPYTNITDPLRVAQGASPLFGHKSACYWFHFANSSSPQKDSKHLSPSVLKTPDMSLSCSWAAA